MATEHQPEQEQEPEQESYKVPPRTPYVYVTKYRKWEFSHLRHPQCPDTEAVMDEIFAGTYDQDILILVDVLAARYAAMIGPGYVREVDLDTSLRGLYGKWYIEQRWLELHKGAPNDDTITRLLGHDLLAHESTCVKSGTYDGENFSRGEVVYLFPTIHGSKSDEVGCWWYGATKLAYVPLDAFELGEKNEPVADERPWKAPEAAQKPSKPSKPSGGRKPAQDYSEARGDILAAMDDVVGGGTDPEPTAKSTAKSKAKAKRRISRRKEEA